ncbi:MAG: hypothetical protein QM296_12840 [Bacillota bacterium]|nr:hypothetical protein [Bacillota bacterium]
MLHRRLEQMSVDKFFCSCPDSGAPAQFFPDRVSVRVLLRPSMNAFVRHRGEHSLVNTLPGEHASAGRGQKHDRHQKMWHLKSAAFSHAFCVVVKIIVKQG